MEQQPNCQNNNNQQYLMQQQQNMQQQNQNNQLAFSKQKYSIDCGFIKYIFKPDYDGVRSISEINGIYPYLKDDFKKKVDQYTHFIIFNSQNDENKIYNAINFANILLALSNSNSSEQQSIMQDFEIYRQDFNIQENLLAKYYQQIQQTQFVDVEQIQNDQAFIEQMNQFYEKQIDQYLKIKLQDSKSQDKTPSGYESNAKMSAQSFYFRRNIKILVKHFRNEKDQIFELQSEKQDDYETSKRCPIFILEDINQDKKKMYIGLNNNWIGCTPDQLQQNHASFQIENQQNFLNQQIPNFNQIPQIQMTNLQQYPQLIEEPNIQIHQDQQILNQNPIQEQFTQSHISGRKRKKFDPNQQIQLQKQNIQQNQQYDQQFNNYQQNLQMYNQPSQNQNINQNYIQQQQKYPNQFHSIQNLNQINQDQLMYQMNKQNSYQMAQGYQDNVQVQNLQLNQQQYLNYQQQPMERQMSNNSQQNQYAQISNDNQQQNQQQTIIALQPPQQQNVLSLQNQQVQEQQQNLNLDQSYQLNIDQNIKNHINQNKGNQNQANFDSYFNDLKEFQILINQYTSGQINQFQFRQSPILSVYFTADQINDIIQAQENFKQFLFQGQK